MAVRQSDPVVGYMFSIEGEGVTGYFTAIEGIGSEHTIVRHKIVTEAGKEMEIKSPGRLEWGDITLKRGLTTDMAFWGWREQVINGDMNTARKNITITMYDRNYQAIVYWHLDNAWPSKISGISISAESNDFVVEEMVIAHEGMRREGAAGYPAILPAR